MRNQEVQESLLSLFLPCFLCFYQIDEDKNLVTNEAKVFATILFFEAKEEEREPRLLSNLLEIFAAPRRRLDL